MLRLAGRFLIQRVMAAVRMQRPPRKPGTRIVSRPPTIRWGLSGLIVAVTAVNLGVVMRREGEVPSSSPLFPYMGWIILGWVLTWAGVELNMFQRLRDTESLTGGQWAWVLGLSLITPGLVWIEKTVSSAFSDTHPPTDLERAAKLGRARRGTAVPAAARSSAAAYSGTPGYRPTMRRRRQSSNSSWRVTACRTHTSPARRR